MPQLPVLDNSIISEDGYPEPEQRTYTILRYEPIPQMVKLPFSTSIYQANAAMIPNANNYAFKSFEVELSISSDDTIMITVSTLLRDIIICRDLEGDAGTNLPPSDALALRGVRCSLELGLKVKAMCECRRDGELDEGMEHYVIRLLYTEEFSI
ncbi:hypothetical protein BJ508DRAFT_336752 [Ascobolus immersus RN42]|uniref:Uncharacterized protein n=1 Tax=Ascobolus immersus RN42 TaxID=1160509 RepID=A0A3N4HEF7_ASCIM|nr:hypothetical protein BJ508DRAFT_336752 [Ascobolus immersus RN42]